MKSVESRADGWGGFGARTIVGPPAPVIPVSTDGKGLESKTHAEALKEKKEPSLGDLNPLLHPPDLMNPEAVEAIILVTRALIDQVGGLQPDTLGVVVIATGISNSPYEPRLIARFNLPNLSEEQIRLIEQTVRQTYGSTARTRTNINGDMIKPSSYPGLENKETKKGDKKPQESGRLLGWYMGPTPDSVSTAHVGAFVHRDLGTTAMAQYVKGYSPKEWFFKPELRDPISEKTVKSKYQVEVREAYQYTTDTVEMVVQLASALGRGELIPHGQLLYKAYNELNRLGLKKAERNQIYGLDELIARVDRVLFLPLANLGLSAGIDTKAGSVLTVGVPGTGKTLLAEYFLSQDTGVFFLPVDPLILANDMKEPPQRRRLLPRISQVFNDTGIPVVLHMDDIENIAEQETIVNSTLLNLMAGVRESGFYVFASTNYPERLSPQLLQPQRFAHLIHFGLPDPIVRKGIMDVHAKRMSRELGIPLFASEDDRDNVLTELSARTNGFTARFLAEICTRAKYYFIQRVAEERGRKYGLTEDDILTTRFKSDDWANAYTEVCSMYDRKGTIERDTELEKFVKKHLQSLAGFDTPLQAGQKESTIVAALNKHSGINGDNLP